MSSINNNKRIHKLTDSHTHLTEDMLADDTETYITNFIDIGGHSLLNVGHDPVSNNASLKLAKRYSSDPRIDYRTSIGLHPQLFYPNSQYLQKITTNEALFKQLRHLEQQIIDNLKLISAIGETGLDYFRLMADKDLPVEQKELAVELQKASFRRHAELSIKFNLPLTVHIREHGDETRCAKDALKILCEVCKGKIRGSFHSYTGSVNIVPDILHLGLFIGFNGIITYGSAENVREILRATPLERVLLETDAPYLPPKSVRSNKRGGSFGQPRDVLIIAEAVANIKGLSTEEVISQTAINFDILFGKVDS